MEITVEQLIDAVMPVFAAHRLEGTYWMSDRGNWLECRCGKEFDFSYPESDLAMPPEVVAARDREPGSTTGQRTAADQLILDAWEEERERRIGNCNSARHLAIRRVIEQHQREELSKALHAIL